MFVFNHIPSVLPDSLCFHRTAYTSARVLLSAECMGDDTSVPARKPSGFCVWKGRMEGGSNRLSQETHCCTVVPELTFGYGVIGDVPGILRVSSPYNYGQCCSI